MNLQNFLRLFFTFVSADKNFSTFLIVLSCLAFVCAILYWLTHDMIGGSR